MSESILIPVGYNIEVFNKNGKTDIWLDTWDGSWSLHNEAHTTLTRELLDELVAALLKVRNKTDGEAERLLRDNNV